MFFFYDFGEARVYLCLRALTVRASKARFMFEGQNWAHTGWLRVVGGSRVFVCSIGA